jgi:hypothetical protein
VDNAVGVDVEGDSIAGIRAERADAGQLKELSSLLCEAISRSP